MLCSQMGLFERSFNCIQFSCCLVLRNSSQGLIKQSLLNLQCEKLQLFKNVCVSSCSEVYSSIVAKLEMAKQKITIYKCEKCLLFQYPLALPKEVQMALLSSPTACWTRGASKNPDYSAKIVLAPRYVLLPFR